MIDVHDEMTALAATRYGEAQFDALTESLPVGVIQVGAHGDIFYSNKWMRDLTGGTDHHGTHRDGIAAEDRPRVDRAFAAAISNRQSTEVDARLINADGRHRPEGSVLLPNSCTTNPSPEDRDDSGSQVQSATSSSRRSGGVGA